MKLTTKQRNALPDSDFAIPSKAPGSGSYPMPDKNHVRAAISMVSRFGSSAEKAAVYRKAAELGYSTDDAVKHGIKRMSR